MADSVDHSRLRDSGKRKSRRRWPWFGLLVPVFFVIAWLEPDEEDLFELCSTQGKPTIYRSVVAEGYYDGAADDCWGCWGYLRNTDYKFIEFSLSRKRRHFDPITEPGIYRVSRIQAGSPQCHEKLTAYYTKAKMMRDEFERNNWCFQVERFDARRARYGYYREGLGVVSRSPVTGSSISASRIYFFDHESSEVVAESTDYGLTKYPLFHVSSFRTLRVCNDFIDRLGIRDLDRQEVIKPRRSVNNEHTD